MKQNLLDLKTRSLLKKNKTPRISLPYTQAHSIGILFSIENREKHEWVKEFIKKLEMDGKEVKVFAYLPEKAENFEFLFDFFTSKDLTFWGNIASDHALRFSETPFDFLFYLDAEPNPMALNLLARSKAKCRIGKFWANSEAFFEFMIESVGGTHGLIDGMYKYTKSLR